ncbi:hypothetical protein H1R20_g14566, partial [Candolleomyces eurysporus]
MPEDSLLHKLYQLARDLPDTVPLGVDSDPLAIFSGDPANADDPGLDADDLWEEIVNTTMKKALGWGEEHDMRNIIRRGDKGVDGLLDFLMKEMENIIKESRIDNDMHHQASGIPHEADLAVTVVGKACQPRHQLTVQPCEGYLLDFPSQSSPHLIYPFALHATLNLPWEYSWQGGMMRLFSRACQAPAKGENVCRACQDLESNTVLEGIQQRMEEGTHENSAFAYHGFGSLIEVLHRKNEQITHLRFKGLNDARKILVRARALSDHKRFAVAVASGDVKRIDRVVYVAMKQGRGILGVLDQLKAASEETYKVKSFTEKETYLATLLWRLGGNRIGSIAHRALGLPSVNTLRNSTHLIPISPSAGYPTAEDVKKNANAALEGIGHLVKAQPNIRHAVLMFDEIAIEKRVRWDSNTNQFFGLCREHSKHTSLVFANEGDVEELFKRVDEDKVHLAAEATVGAIGFLCKESRIYPARPLLLSGDCKRESGKEHANLLSLTVEGINTSAFSTELGCRVISLASDGESRRGLSLVQVTFKQKLPPNSNIYPLLSPLIFLNLHVGDDDLTCDKDWKHVFKRARNLLLRQRGIVVGGAVLNPDDQQDVRLAIDLLHNIWSLPCECSKADSQRLGFPAARRALWIFGRTLFHLVFPYLCVDLSLSEQLEHLSAAAHLAFVLYKAEGMNFLPTMLYTDIMIMIKNVFFCVAKVKVDTLDGSFYIILLGTDRLEIQFGVLRTMVANDCNLDMLQLGERMGGATDVLNILADYPEWDKEPRRLHITALTRNSTATPESADHLSPKHIRGDVRVKNVSLQTSWNRGRRMAEEEYPEAVEILRGAEGKCGIDILAPNGKMLFEVPLPSNDVDESLESIAFPNERQVDDQEDAVPTAAGISNAEMQVEIEDELEVLLDRSLAASGPTQTKPAFEHTITIGDKVISKARVLSMFSKYRKKVSSTDRLKRVQEIERYHSSQTMSTDLGAGLAAGTIDSRSFLLVHDPVASLLCCEKKTLALRWGSQFNSLRWPITGSDFADDASGIKGCCFNPTAWASELDRKR